MSSYRQQIVRSFGVILFSVLGVLPGRAQLEEMDDTYGGFEPASAPTAGWLTRQIGFVSNVGQYPDSVLFVAKTESGECVVTRRGLTAVGSRSGAPCNVDFGRDDVRWRPLQPDSCLVSAFLGDRPERWIRGARAYRSLICDPDSDGNVLVCAATDGQVFLATNDQATMNALETSVARVAEPPQELHLVLIEGPDNLRARFDGATADRILAGFAAQVRAAKTSSSPVRIAEKDETSTSLSSSAGTYLGGTHGDDRVIAVANAPNGDVFVAGQTESVFFPGTSDGWQPAENGGRDWFVARMSPQMDMLISATYLGGHGDELMYDEVTDCIRDGGMIALADGDVLLFGITKSADFPCTTAACGPRGNWDAAVARLSGDLTELRAASRFGGTGGDGINQIIEVEGHGLIACGGTRSSTISEAAFAGQQNAGRADGMIVELDQSLAVVQGALIGGALNDYLTSLTAAGDTAWVAIGTESSTILGVDLIVGRPGGGKDAGLVAWDLNAFRGRRLLRYGASGTEYARDVMIDESGAPLLLLSSYSQQLPGAVYSKRYPGLTVSGRRTGIARYLGAGEWQAHLLASSGDVDLVRFAALPARSIAAVGFVACGDSAYVVNELQSHAGNGQNWDTGYLAVFAADDLAVRVATLFGGDRKDCLIAACPDPVGDLLVGGWTTSSYHPGDADWDPFQPEFSETNRNHDDGFLARFTYEIEDAPDTPELLFLTPALAARAAGVTLTVRGRRLETIDDWRVQDASGQWIPCDDWHADAMEASARFDFTSAALGLADLGAFAAGVEVARLTGGFSIADLPCEGPRLSVLGEVRMRGGDWRRPNVISLLIENPCGQDITPVGAVGIEVSPWFTEMRPVSPVGSMPSEIWPIDTSQEPIIIADEDGGVISLFPPPIPAGGYVEWTGQFQVPIPPAGERRPRGMSLQARWMRQQLDQCALALNSTALLELIDAVFRPCLSDVLQTIASGYGVFSYTGPRDRRWMNDLGFIISVVRATASCSALMPARAALALIRLRNLAMSADSIVTWGEIIEACGPPLGAGLATALGYSFDPNEIAGPMGKGSANAITSTDDLTYTVLFENAPSATASATDVRIDIPLDPRVFDLTSVRSLSFGFGAQTIELDHLGPGDTLRFTIPEQEDLVLLCTMDVDATLELMVWRIMARNADDLSMPLFDGFLPPNDEAGSGEGFVRFRIRGADGLTSGATISAQATITFDLNEPIVTNTWTNTFDPDPPTASLWIDGYSVTGMEKLKWATSDRVSGVRSTILVGFPVSGDPRILPATSANGEYRLQRADLSLASVAIAVQDTAGNWSESEVVEFANAGESGAEPLQVYAAMPNPANGEALWQARVNEAGQGRAEVFDVAGRKVAMLFNGPIASGRAALRWDLRNDNGAKVASGVYFLKVTVNGHGASSRVLVLK